jgi:riboflavin synthase
MFTGLIRAIGLVDEVLRTSSGARLVVDIGTLADGATVGDSVALAGACLTLTDLDGSRGTFDAVEETLRRTTIGQLARGRRVNLEPALRAGEPIGGHFVSGHVDGVGQLAHTEPAGEGAEMRFTADRAVLADIVEKGSVALDGVSLTVAGIEADGFRVAIVPHTLRATTLGDLRPGQRVNIETDMLVKSVRRVMQTGGPDGSGISEGFLRRHGFA